MKAEDYIVVLNLVTELPYHVEANSKGALEKFCEEKKNTTKRFRCTALYNEIEHVCAQDA